MKKHLYKFFVAVFIIGAVFLFMNESRVESKSPELAVIMASSTPSCPSCAGGAIPPDIDELLSDEPVTSSSAAQKNTPPIGVCLQYNLTRKTTPVNWYWPVYKNIHLQIYDSTGAWWFNGWVKSNSYTVFSKDGKGQLPGVPSDGRTIYAKISYGGRFTSAGVINCRP